MISYGTGTPLAKCFDQYEVIDIINQIIKFRKVVCFEAVEVTHCWMQRKQDGRNRFSGFGSNYIYDYFTYRIIFFYSNIRSQSLVIYFGFFRANLSLVTTLESNLFSMAIASCSRSNASKVIFEQHDFHLCIGLGTLCNNKYPKFGTSNTFLKYRR
jgi:hypothetical protein